MGTNAKSGSNGRVLANPTDLKPVNKENGLVQVIIETPKGCRNKYAFDSEQAIFALRKVLPAGMAFPYDFGFLPRTQAPDGDPIDVLLLMDEPAYPGIAVQARLIGVLEAEETEGKALVRNDRLIAVAAASHMYENIRSIDDLPERWLKELEQFFVNYLKQQGKEYRLLGCKDENEARTLIEAARRAARVRRRRNG